MKLSFFVCLFFTAPLFSSFVGSPSTPSLAEEGLFLSDELFFSFRTGLVAGKGTDEKLKFYYPLKAEGFSSLTVKSVSCLGDIVVNFKERLDLYFQGGISNFDLSFSQNEIPYHVKTGDGFMGKGGARVALIENKNTTFGGDVHYRFCQTPIKTTNVSVADSGRYLLREWQISVAVSQKIGWLSPYLGLCVRRSKQKMPSYQLSQRKELRFDQKQKPGLFLGVAMNLGSKLFASFEGHVINEASFFGQLEIRL